MYFLRSIQRPNRKAQPLWLGFFFILLSISLPLSVQALEIVCSNDHLISIESKNNKFFLSQNQCLSSQTERLPAAIDSEFIKIIYSKKSINKNKTGDYYRKDLEKVVKLALALDVDPYAALAILLIEKPPLKVVGQDLSQYKKSYGLFPVDAVAAYDTLGCSTEKKNFSVIKDPKELAAYVKEYSELPVGQGFSYTNKNPVYKKLATVYTSPALALTQVYCEAMTSTNQSKLCSKYYLQRKTPPIIDLSSAYGTGSKPNKVSVCSEQFVTFPGQPPSFEFLGEQQSSQKIKNCCAEVIAPYPNDELRSDFLSTLGILYLKKSLSSCKSNNIALCLQKYNGLGCFNCTERMNSSCLNGLVMMDRHFYGSRVLDLMVNSLMSNNEINDLVLNASKSGQTTVQSVFCKKENSSVVEINEDKYLNEQRKFLLGGLDNQFEMSLLYRGVKDNTAPQTESDFELYRQNEARRISACQGYFK